MRNVLAKYWVVVHVALLTAFLSWVHGGTRVQHLSGVPWLSLAVLEAILILPSTRKNETLDAARSRTLGTILWDPLLYIGAALSLFLLVQVLNGGCHLVFDAESGKWIFSNPPTSWGPYCVEPREARQVLYWFPPAFAAALGIRHGMNRRGKLYLLRFLVLNGAALSVFGALQAFTGTHRLFWLTPMEGHFFASFGYDGHAGAFFTLMFLINAGLFLHAMLEERRQAIWLGTTLALNLLGVFLSFSQVAMLLTLSSLAIGSLYAFRHAWRRISAAAHLKSLAVFVTSLALGAVLLLFAWPDNPALRELRKTTQAEARSAWFATRAVQARAAWQIWQDHPWFGVGGWGYRQYVVLPQYTDEATLARLQRRGAANVHNDFLQFLAEHGAVGLGLMLGAVAVLWIPIVRRLWIAHASGHDGWMGDPWLLFRISPLTVFLLAATLVTFLHSLIDLPFRSPAIVLGWTIALACAPAFLPAARKVEAPKQAVPIAAARPAAETKP